MNAFERYLGDCRDQFDRQVDEAREWFAHPRFEGILRLYSPRDIAEQWGTISAEYPIAREAAIAFHARLRELFKENKSITTFGPYSPGQAVVMKRLGIEGIYLGGWATSAKGGITEDPGADLASYPLNQVPDEAATIVRALLTADRNQHFAHARMSPEKRNNTPEVDYRPFIIADADTGHGGDAHVRNLIRRFVEAGICGYHIEDQKPGAKKCGHQGGKVLVCQDEQIKRLNSARFQLDVMRVPGIIVARTDAEAATLLDGSGDERDQPFILGATNVEIPSYKSIHIAILRKFNECGIEEINGHKLFALSDAEYEPAFSWMNRTGVTSLIEESSKTFRRNGSIDIDAMLDVPFNRFLETWQAEAGLKTFGQAIADIIEFRTSEGERFDMTLEEWKAFSRRASFCTARQRAKEMGINTIWDCELPKTPDGYYQIQGGIEYAIAKSVTAAPFADLLWMETKTANLLEAAEYAKAIHAEYPDKMLAYNLSPSFNWDTTGMSEEEMRRFPEELGKLGYVFNFITYGGHQVDGLAAEEFATELKQDGMLALARLQRKIRLVESPYRTPQTLVGGPRLDAALLACSGRAAITKAMGKGSTQHQHLVQTEVPTRLLEEWLKIWAEHNRIPAKLSVQLRPHSAGSDLLKLSILNEKRVSALIFFAYIQDRRGRSILSIRDQNTYELAMRKKRLMTLAHLYLIHRYRIDSVHYVTPTEDNQYQTQKMKDLGIYSKVNTEVGQIIVAVVDSRRIAELLNPDQVVLRQLIEKK
jgi:isocitrate lyase